MTLIQDIQRKPELVAEVQRPIRPSDLALLAERPVATKPFTLKKLGDRHHRLARALASGMGTTEAATACGYSVSRVSILKDDPSFDQLVKHYRSVKTEVFADTYEELGGLARDAISELRDRLEEEPEKMSNKTLLDVLKVTADRSGFGPTSRQETVNLNLSGRLAQARQRVREKAMDLEVIENEAT